MADLSDGRPDAAAAAQSDPPPNDETPTLRRLFLICFKVGLLSFGGGLSAWYYRDFVTRRKWIDEEEFMSSWAISQMLPGANITNMTVLMGERIRGVPGILVGLFGLILGPFFIVIALDWVFSQIPDVSLAEAISTGVAAAALGLLGTVCVMGVLRQRNFPPGLLLAAITAITVGILHWPLIPVVLALGPVGVALKWRNA